jgi:branched-chain amino acid aminotransferase
VGGNYAPTIAPQEEAAQQGFNQVLWLFGPEQEITEVGTMNLFFYMRGEDGVNELVTAPLNDIVLPGVTRDSIIQLARQHKIRVSERRQTMQRCRQAESPQVGVHPLRRRQSDALPLLRRRSHPRRQESCC